MEKGTMWNESKIYKDPVTLRDVRRITTHGLYNQTPTYHTGTAFTDDGQYLVFGSIRDGKSYVLKCRTETGDLTVLAEYEGIGGRCFIHREDGKYPGDGNGVEGCRICLAPRSRWCVFPVGRSVRALHLETMEERILIDDTGEEWIMGVPGIAPDEKTVAVSLCSSHPHLIKNKPITKSYLELSGDNFPALKIIEVPLAGGKARTIYQENGCSCAHVQYNPKNSSILLIDRDLPPRLWCGSDGKTPRLWLLNRDTGKVKPVKEEYPGPFQVHATWSFDGSLILYHGFLPPGGWYLGAATTGGETIKEYILPDAHGYGHVSADPKRRAFILDGNVTSDLLLWYYFDSEIPRVEVIARHATAWETLPGQFADPHPLADPTGQWISFNSAHSGRSDVLVVNIRG